MSLLKPYLKYKEGSGDWLGAAQVPSHWTEVRLGRLASLKSGAAISAEHVNAEGTYPVYGGGGFRGFTEEKTDTGEHVLVGRQGALCGNVRFVDGDFFATEHALVSYPRMRQCVRWFAYALGSMNLGQYSQSAAQPGLSAEVLESKTVLVPTIEEQNSIADFLDRETAEIDAFIADQEELIGLLAERRAATINYAVTKGLDPTVPMKYSGIVWARNVPSHWVAGNIRHFAHMRTGHTPSRSRPEYWVDCAIPWFTLADVWQLRQGRRYLGETKGRISQIGLENSAAELLPQGTVVLSRTASVGFTGIMPRPMATSQDYWNWICRPRLAETFLWYQFIAMRAYFASLVQGSTHKTIYQADAAALAIVVPPRSEQLEIVAHLDHEIGEIDSALLDAREAIVLSRERRAALISAAVTGKIDVRGLV